MELQFYGAVGAVTVSWHGARSAHFASDEPIALMIDLVPCA
jgi:hypothetical protein